jgi:hypothetical protein
VGFKPIYYFLVQREYFITITMADATPPPQIIFDVTATATTATHTLHERHNMSNALKLL